MHRLLSRTRALAASLVLATGAAAAADLVALPGHVLPALTGAAEVVVRTKALAADDEPITLTVVLKRDYEVAFQAFLADLQDPSSASFRKYLSPVEVSNRYGPSQESYDLLKQYFETRGFVLVEGSANRMTLTLRGSRAMAESALSVPIVDYRIGDKSFRANAAAPKLPAELAWRVQAVVGLSDLAVPRSPLIVDAIKSGIGWAIRSAFCAVVKGLFSLTGNAKNAEQLVHDYFAWCNDSTSSGSGPKAYLTRGDDRAPQPTHATAVPLPGTPRGVSSAGQDKAGNPDWLAVTGAGQTIGILSYDNYATGNLTDYYDLVRRPELLARVSRVAVNGGTAPGPDQREVLVDVISALNIAPGANVVVYHAPKATSYQTMLNAMIAGGVTIISNSWAYCENQTTPADVQSIDALFASAAASGISAFNASGDSGSTCLNGSPNTAAVPATSPHATAVGGTSLTLGLGGVYGSETWWDSSAEMPPVGQGGHGTSAYFPRPAYQDGHTASAMRSVPDVSANADPYRGMILCQAEDGGCPTGKLYGGTSMSTPMWAAFAALLNESVGTPLGAMNASLYPRAGAPAFHDAASMGSDFGHVGLGSPDLDRLSLALGGGTVGAVNAGKSRVLLRSTVLDGIESPPVFPIPADGVSQAVVVVYARDAAGHIVGGKTVALAANPGSSAVVSPASVATTAASPWAVFTVTDLVPETVTFTATDVTDSLVLTQTAQATFVVPPAASASIVATPTSVLNDGIATTTITVKLVDALARPTPGKLVVLSQGGGHSIVSGPNPSVTDAAGTIVFTATNTHAETVTYTAVDATDGDLDVPGSAVVDFTGQPTSTCATVVPAAAPGYAITPWSTGYPASAFFYSGISFGCAGALNPVFDAQGGAYVPSFPDGKLFHLPSSGGAASSGFLLATHGPTLAQPAFGKDGRLYVARTATGGGGSSGAIYEIDPDDGAILRTVVSGLTCPQEIAVDPLSGDLFFADTCFGGGLDDARVFRVSDPAGTPSVSPYATMPSSPTGVLVFAPDGTLYVQSNYLDATPKVQRVTGTDKPQPATVTEVPGLNSIFWLTIAETLPTGAVKSMVVLGTSGLRLADLTTDPPTYTDLTVGQTASGTIGPDGCLYFTAAEAIYRLTKSDGSCGFGGAAALPRLALTPAIVTPDPTQGEVLAFDATFANLDVPAGTPVSLIVDGANPGMRVTSTDAAGIATFAYQGIVAGADRVKAIATVGGTHYESNVVRVTWGPGKHVSFLTVARSPGGGTPGAATTLRATLVDTSVDPFAPIAGATIHFSLGALVCDGVTDSQGTASCDVVPAVPGASTLTASFAGDASFTPASATQGFQVLAAPNPACFDGPLPGGGNARACVAGALPGCQFASAQFVSTASVGTPPPSGVSVPYGLFQFVATGCGGSATLTLTYPSALPANATYWKFGPTSGQASHWYTMPAVVAGNTISVTFVDGGDGDSDLAADGSITDPGGAGVLAAVAGPTVPVPALDRLGLLALSVLLLLMVARRRLR